MRTFASLALWIWAFTLLWTTTATAAESWDRVQSEHFTVVGEGGHAQLERVARTLEQFRDISARGFPDLALDTSRPLTVVVLGNGRMQDFGPGLSNVAGYYQPLPDADFIVMTGALRGASFRVVLHEYQHLISRATWGELPRWVNEGLAELNSTFETEGDGTQVKLGLPIADHIRTLNERGTVPLERFLSADGQAVGLDERFRIGIFYAQSWALMHFFNFGDDGKWAGSLGPFVDALVSGAAPIDAFRRTVTPDIGDFERRFQAYVVRSRYSFIALKSRVRPSFAPAARGRLSVAETETIKARLLTDPRKADEALADALAADPQFPGALRLRAESWLTKREWTKAAEELTAVVERDPGDVRSCSLAMFALNALGQHERGLAVCAAQTAADPSLTFERAVALEHTGRQAEAAQTYGRVRIQTDDYRHDWWRSWRYLEVGSYAAAAKGAELWGRKAPTPDQVAYDALVRAMAACLSGACQEGRTRLARDGQLEGAGSWVTRVVRFVLEPTDAAGFIKAARSPGEETEAHCYVGLEQLARGQRAEAIEHLKWIADKGAPTVSEYNVCVAHYRRLTAQASGDGAR